MKTNITFDHNNTSLTQAIKINGIGVSNYMKWLDHPKKGKALLQSFRLAFLMGSTHREVCDLILHSEGINEVDRISAILLYAFYESEKNSELQELIQRISYQTIDHLSDLFGRSYSVRASQIAEEMLKLIESDDKGFQLFTLGATIRFLPILKEQVLSSLN